MLSHNSVIYANNIPNQEVFDKIVELTSGDRIAVIVEDMAPYRMRITPQVIDTCKFIGELSYRLSVCDLIEDLRMAPRNEVKKWVFDCFPDVVLPRLEKKMIAVDRRKRLQGLKGLLKSDGEMRAASFHYVDDRVIIASMKFLFDIHTPKPGKLNVHGLKDHSWQALAVAAYYEKNIPPD